MDFFSTECDFEQREFRGLSGSGDCSGREYNSCTFIKCNFREVILRNSRFRDCTFKNCDLSLVDLTFCSFFTTRFEDSQLVGINWMDTHWAKLKLVHPLDFVGCALNHSTFSGLNLSKMSLVSCVARDVDFTDANLTRALCNQTDFANSRFVHTNLTETDFTGAKNYSIAPTLNTLKKTRFSMPEAMSLLYNLDIVLTDEE